MLMKIDYILLINRQKVSENTVKVLVIYIMYILCEELYLSKNPDCVYF